LETLEKYLTTGQRELFQKQLQQDLPSPYRQRLQIMILADQGQTQKEICLWLGCCPATAHYWMQMARAGLADRWQDCPIGRPKSVSNEYIKRLRELLECSPRDCGYFFQRWTVHWLSKQLEQELGLGLSVRHLKRIMKHLGLSTLAKTGGSTGSQIVKEFPEMGNSQIEIVDLQSSPVIDLSFAVATSIPINIYGSQSVLPIHFSPTARCGPRLPHFLRRISALYAAG
jgi:transposase